MYDDEFAEMARTHTDWCTVPRVYNQTKDGTILCLECINPDASDPTFTGTCITNMNGLCHATKERYRVAKWVGRAPDPPHTSEDLEAFEKRNDCTLPHLLAFYLTNVSSEFVCLEEWVKLTDPVSLPHIIDMKNVRDDGFLLGQTPDTDSQQPNAYQPRVIKIGMEGTNICYVIVDGPGAGWALLSTSIAGQYFMAPLWAYILEPVCNAPTII